MIVSFLCLFIESYFLNIIFSLKLNNKLFKMCDRRALLEETTKYFENINFEEIGENWIEEAVENEFNDVEEKSISPSILFDDSHYSPSQTLYKISSICDKWFTFKNVIFDDSDTSSRSRSSVQEDTLWTCLNSIDITVKQIQGLVFLLCSQARKSSSSIEEKELGLLSAKLYFSCLKVPGSSAYSIFHPNLFKTCIDCLQMPSHAPETKDTVYVWKDFQLILSDFISTLDSLIPLINEVHLGSDVSTVEYVIQKLVELFACEASNNKLKFDIDILTMNKQERKRYYSESYVVTLLASRGLWMLAKAELNGEKESNCAFILSGLNEHISCMKMKKATNIPHKFIIIRDNAVSFIDYCLKNDLELFSAPVQTTLKRLCILVCDKADFRATVSNAVYSLMFGLDKNDLVDFIQWLLLLVDSSEISNRNIALEVLSLLLSNKTLAIDTEEIPDSKKVYLTFIPLIFAILTRCDDISPVIRSKALTVLSQHIETILNSLKNMMDDKTSTLLEEFDDIECNMNGDHRMYWYTLDSYRKIVDEIASILYRRCEDDASAARKSAYQALEHLLNCDETYLTDNFLKPFVSSARDENTNPRKQVIDSLTVILNKYPDNSLAQDYWLKCIPPLVNDPETTVQDKALSVMEEKFQRNVFSISDDKMRKCVFSLLEKLSQGKYLSHKRYLQKSFSLWKTNKRLSSLNVCSIEKCFGHGNDEFIWFYVSMYAGFAKLPAKLTERAVEELQKEENWLNPDFMESILKLFNHSYSILSTSKLEMITDILTSKLENLSAPLEVYPLLVEVLKKLQDHLQNDASFLEFVTRVMQNCISFLKVKLEKKNNEGAPSEEVVIKSFTIIKEVCHLFPALISTQLKDVLKPFRSFGKKYKWISPTVRAHAFACIGKVAIQDEKLAKEIIPDMAYQLLNCQNDAIRNNIVVIMIDMCKRFTSLADQYVSIISRCFQDKRYLIRYQAITMIVNLLQEDYIKWRGTLFYCLLLTVIDKQENIQELGKYCLCSLLMSKKENIFCDHFIDSIYVFNSYWPPNNDNIKQLVNDLEVFDLQNKHEMRKQLYEFMLTNMDGYARMSQVATIISKILSSVGETVYPLNSKTENMVRDCFHILCSQEMRLIDGSMINENEMDEDNIEQFNVIEKESRKICLVKPLIKPIISLKNCAMAEKSPLYADIITFLKELLYEFQNDVPELLSEDKTLENQIQREFKIDQMQKEKEAKESNKKESKKCSTQNGPQNPSSIAVAKANESQRFTAKILEKEMESMRRESGINDCNLQDSLRLVSKTPQNRSRKTAMQSQAMEVDPVPSTSRQQLPMSSTPYVVLERLRLPKTPDISRLTFPVDSDEDV